MSFSKHYFNLLFIFISVVWVPFQRYYLQVDGAGRTILVLSVVALILNVNEIRKRKYVFLSPPFILWTILVLYAMVNSYYKGFISEYGGLTFYKNNYINPYVFLLILIIELDTFQRRCLRVLFGALMTFVLIGISKIAGDTGERMLVEELGNLLPLNAVCALLVSALLYTRHRMSSIIFYLLTVILLLLIIVSGTRKALGAAIIIIIGVIISKNARLSLGTFVRTILYGVILYMFLSYILDNTLIGMRITESAELSDVVFTENKRINGFLMTILGDRAIMYWEGWFIWLQNFLTGIGVMNFMVYSGLPNRLHTEYIVQLCENGIIGFTLLILVYYYLYKGIRRNKREMIMGLFTFITLLFLNITTWTYCAMFGMIFYGILFNEAYSKLKFNKQ